MPNITWRVDNDRLDTLNDMIWNVQIKPFQLISWRESSREMRFIHPRADPLDPSTAKPLSSGTPTVREWVWGDETSKPKKERWKWWRGLKFWSQHRLQTQKRRKMVLDPLNTVYIPPVWFQFWSTAYREPLRDHPNRLNPTNKTRIFGFFWWVTGAFTILQ